MKFRRLFGAVAMPSGRLCVQRLGLPALPFCRCCACQVRMCSTHVCVAVVTFGWCLKMGWVAGGPNLVGVLAAVAAAGAAPHNWLRAYDNEKNPPPSPLTARKTHYGGLPDSKQYEEWINL